VLQSTFRQLEVFTIVVDEGSFAAGAERLGISQPAVSNHIRALERQVGFALMDRRRGAKAGLTEQGRQLYEQTTVLLHQAEQIASGLPRARSREKARELAIVAQPYVISRWIQPLMTEFLQHNPKIIPVIRGGYFEEVVRTIENGGADLGYFVSDGPCIDIKSERICSVAGGLYVSSSHPLAGRKNLTASEIALHAFIMPVRASHFGAVVTRTLASVGIVGYPVAFQAHSIDMTREMVRSGAGVLCMFDSFVESDVLSGRLTRLEFEIPALELHQFRSRRPRPGSPVDMFVSHMIRHIRSEEEA
jgi:DNA-binding transcriptional LysR family regulator